MTTCWRQAQNSHVALVVESLGGESRLGMAELNALFLKLVCLNDTVQGIWNKKQCGAY